MLFKIIFNGTKKRKGDTLALGSVLFLSFFFLTLCAILFSSIAHTEQLSRQNLYGTWQVLHYGAGDAVLSAYEDRTEHMAASILCGETGSGQIIASLNEAAYQSAGFELLEGRLPEKENEIVLVQGAFEDGFVGSEIQIQHNYNYMSVAADHSGAQKMQADILSILKNDPEQLSAFEAQYDQLWSMHGGSGTIVPIDQLTAEEYDRMLLFYGFSLPQFRQSAIEQKDNHLDHYEDINMTVRSSWTQITLMGEGFGEDQYEVVQTAYADDCLILYGKYTVTGILRPYDDRWDTMGYQMPAAFISDAMADKIERAISYVQEKCYPDAPKYARRSIAWFYDPAGDAFTLCDALLPAYHDTLRASYRIEGLSHEGANFSGYLAGIEETSGEEIYLPFSGSQNIGRITYRGKSHTFALSELQSGQFLIEGIVPFETQALSAAQLAQHNTQSLRLNTYAYPSASNSASPAMWEILRLVLIALTACATFQIFWAQLKRRRARMVTLLSIGAQDHQIILMLLGELALILLAALPLGTLLGYLTAKWMTAHILDAVFFVQRDAVLLGLLLGVLASFLGAAAPIALAVRAPLTGREAVRTSYTPRERTMPIERALKIRRRGNSFIAVRNLTMNRARSALGVIFAFLLCAILVLTLFLSYNVQNNFRRQVLEIGKPDYQLKAPYGLSSIYTQRVVEAMEEQLTPGSVETLRAAENVYLKCDAYLSENGSPILRALKNHPQGAGFFKLREDGQTELRTHVYGIELGSVLYEKLSAAITSGSIDPAKFDAGEECILLVPLYRESDGAPLTRQADSEKLHKMPFEQQLSELLDVSYDSAYAGAYKADTAISVGDTLTYSAISQMLDPKTNTRVDTEFVVTCRVAAVIHYFPEEGIWPFSGDAMTHVAISGTHLCHKLYPLSGTRMNAAATKGFAVMSQLFYPDCYGKTYLYVSDILPESADPALRDSACARFADSYGFTFENHRLTADALYADAQKSMYMVLLLGAAAVLIVLSILSSTSVSQIEQDRRRFGILQGIGASDGQLTFGRCLQALLMALPALILAHVLLAFGVMIYAAARQIGGSFSPALLWAQIALLFEGYPAGLHGLICLISALVYVFLTARPIRAICRRLPIDNIRG